MDTRPSSAVGPNGGGLLFQGMPGHLVRRLQQVAVRLFAEEVGADMTPVQFAALEAAAKNPGMDQAALSVLIGYDRATIGGVIDRLEAKGWVERKPSEQDRRVRLVGVTRAGRAALERATAAVRRVQERLVEPLTTAERERFQQLCLKLLDHHLG